MIQISTLPGTDITLVEVSGKLTEAMSENISQLLLSSVRRGHSKIILDLGQVIRMGKVLLNLLPVLTEAKSRGGNICLATLPAELRQQDILVYVSKFSSYPSVDEAVASFAEKKVTMLEITTEAKDGVVILHLTGGIDRTTVLAFGEKMKRHISANEVCLILEISGLRFINAAGLCVLSDSLTQVRVKGGKILLVRLSPSVNRTFRIMGFDRFFPRYDSVEDAYQAFQKG